MALSRLVFFFTCFLFLETSGQQMTSQKYREDFDFFWGTVKNNYSYWDKKQTDWDKVKQIYNSIADTITTRRSFVSLVEQALNELYDHHASLNTNNAESRRLVPSGADIWAEYDNGKPMILELRENFGAEKSGLEAGMQIFAVNGVAIDSAVNMFLPKSLKKTDIESKNFALRLALAGNHIDNRVITAGFQHQRKDYFPDKPVNLLEANSSMEIINSKILEENIGYIRINNNLGDDELVNAFDSVLDNMMQTNSLILDLRSTPSGGTTSVARAIMGRFITKEGYYQKHELTSEQTETGIKRSWVEIVSPRKKIYHKPMLILVDHWTGSVAEGIAIGFDALKRGKVMGTKMAALNGANYSFNMPNTGIRFSFPAEKLFHVNGSPRENFTPPILIDISKKKNTTDYILDQALKYLKKNK
jgi:carboxyl-terminal processing protease